MRKVWTTGCSLALALVPTLAPTWVAAQVNAMPPAAARQGALAPGARLGALTPAAGSRQVARAPRQVAYLAGDAPKTNTRCRSELSPEALDRGAAKAASMDMPAESGSPMDATEQLKQVAKEAVQRSQAVGVSKWLAEAAALDLEQTEAGRWPVVSVNAGVYKVHSTVDDTVVNKGRQSSVGVSVGANLFDGGKQSSLIGWRQELEKSARHSVKAQQEAVILEAVTTVLERNRYRTQAQVYQQHARKMACLVEALEAIVAEDQGRASELVQVRKNQAQAELSRDSAVAQSRQIELKLKRLLGDRFATGEAIGVTLASTPDLGELYRTLEQSSDALQLKAQIDAQEQYAKALRAGLWPQLNLSIAKTNGSTQDARTAGWQAGVSLNYNLFDGFAERAGIEAAVARAESSRAQYADFIAGRTERMGSVHDNALSAFDRAKRYIDILRDSDLVRNFTFQQWSQLGRRSLFDLMSAEGDHFSLRIAYVNTLYDGYEANAQLRSMGGGLVQWLQVEPVR